jgi:hypothetical protein
VRPDFGNAEFRPPPVIDQWFHRDFGPQTIGLLSIQKQTPNGIVTVREYVGFDNNFLPNCSFDWKTATINFRFHCFDDNPAPSLIHMHISSSPRNR